MQRRKGPAGETPVAEAVAPAVHVVHARLLGRIDLFRGLDRVTLAKLAAHLQPLSFAAGTVVFRQGEPGDAFYLVANGSVAVYSAGPGGVATRVKVLQPGDPFGEMALLGNRPRTATITAESDCEVLRLERGAFLDLVREHPNVALSLAATLSHRLAGMLGQPEPASGDAPPPVPAKAPTGTVAAATAATTAKRRRPGRSGIALVAGIAIFAVGWMAPPPSGLSLPAWHALVILLAALPALVLDTLLEGVLALLIATAWVVSGATAPAVALSGFATSSWILVVAVLIIGAGITATGVLYRLALETIARMRGGFAGEAAALSIAGLLIGPAVPNATSRVIIIAPMLKELVEALGYRPQSKPSAGLSMAVLIGFGQMAAAFLTSSTTGVLVAAVLPPEAQKDVNWLTWALYAAPTNLILFAGVLAFIIWFYRPRSGQHQREAKRADLLKLQKALLGRMSRDEKIAIGVGVGLLAGFMTQPLHRIDPAWVAVLATGILTATRVITVNTLRAVNWNFALLFGVLISLATVFNRTGLDRWITEGVAAVAGDVSSAPVLFVVVLSILCFAITFVVRWQAAAPLITIALAPVASAAGVHPFIVGLIAVIAGNGFFMPYQSTTYLALYAGTGGKLFTHRQAFPTSVAYAVCAVIAIALSVPAWRWMGLL